MTTLFRTLLTLAAGIAVSANAQTLPSIAHNRYTLPNGLEVILHEDHSVPYAAVTIMYKVGSGDERRGRTGFAHLFEHVMFMGSENVPEGKFDQWLEAAGGDNNAWTSDDATNYYETVPANAIPLALWLDADRMGRMLSTMTQAKLDVQRDIVKNERREGIDNVPYGRADETIRAALFPPGHPYHWTTIGSMEDLTAASLEDVKSFFRMYYAPNNATLTIAGDFRSDSVRAWIQRYFGDIPRGAEMPLRPTVPAVRLPKDTFMVLEDRVQLPRLYYTWHSVRIYHEDDAALDVLSYILAGDKNARLYKRLVYEMQAAQEVNAGQVSNHLDGYYSIDVTPKPERTPTEMAGIINDELNKLVDQGVTTRELERAKNSIRARQVDRLASVLGKATQMNVYNYFAGTPDYARQDAARYDRVTGADVQRVARTYLGAPKVVLTVVPTGETKQMVTGGVR